MQADSTTTATQKHEYYMKKTAHTKSPKKTQHKKRKSVTNFGSEEIAKKKKHSTKKETASRHDDTEEEESSGDEEWMDLNREVKPIGHYIDDRVAMLDEMLSVTKGKLFKNMLPDLLANISAEDLKSLFLTELEGMSKKRIGSILAGEDMIESSDTDDNENNEDIGTTSNKQSQPVKTNIAADSTSVGVVHDSTDTQTHSEATLEGEEPGVSSTTPGLSTTAANNESSVLNNDQLEILELELRARAIRSLMDAMNGKDLPTSTNPAAPTSVVSSEAAKQEGNSDVIVIPTEVDDDNKTGSYDHEDCLELEPGELL